MMARLYRSAACRPCQMLNGERNTDLSYVIQSGLLKSVA